MSWKRIFLIVTACALAGMVLGGLFGFAAGKLTPDFFHHIIPWQDVEPVGIATFLGATVGVLLGGGLGCFGVAIQIVLEWRKPAKGPEGGEFSATSMETSRQIKRISFDIDDVLVCAAPSVPTETKLWPWAVPRRFGEPLRSGTRALFQQLRRRGCTIWIYTSSLRAPFDIRLWLLRHGVRVNGIVNADRHRRELSRRGLPVFLAKYPPAFDIDLHIDDSQGVQWEGEDHGFKVLLVSPYDKNWTQKILGAVDRVATGSGS